MSRKKKMSLGTDDENRSGPAGRFCASCPRKSELCRAEGSGPQNESALSRGHSNRFPIKVQVSVCLGSSRQEGSQYSDRGN